MDNRIPANVIMCIRYLQSIDKLVVDDEDIQFYYHKRNDKEYLFVLFEDCYSEEFKEKREQLLGGEWQKQENGEYYLYFNVNVIFSCIFELFDRMRLSMFTWKEQPSILDLKEEAGKMIRI